MACGFGEGGVWCAGCAGNVLSHWDQGREGSRPGCCWCQFVLLCNQLDYLCCMPRVCSLSFGRLVLGWGSLLLPVAGSFDGREVRRLLVAAPGAVDVAAFAASALPPPIINMKKTRKQKETMTGTTDVRLGGPCINKHYGVGRSRCLDDQRHVVFMLRSCRYGEAARTRPQGDGTPKARWAGGAACTGHKKSRLRACMSRLKRQPKGKRHVDTGGARGEL